MKCSHCGHLARVSVPHQGGICCINYSSLFLPGKMLLHILERAINRLKQWKRIATRYEKLAANYTAMQPDRLHYFVATV